MKNKLLKVKMDKLKKQEFEFYEINEFVIDIKCTGQKSIVISFNKNSELGLSLLKQIGKQSWKEVFG